MATSSESVKQMLLAHKRKDDAAFRQAVGDYIADERKRNHPGLARELERILLNGSMMPSVESTSFTVLRNDFPRDRERNATLVELQEPQREQDSLILSQEVRSILDHLIDENRRSEILRSHGMRPANKILFCGPPGCGKTVASEMIAKALYRPLALVRFDAVVSSFLGETAANLRKVFDFARSRPLVILFDEFDAIGKYRTDESEHGELKRVVNSFLQMMDSFRGESLLIAATNHQGLLDSALWRRFDEIVFFGLPTREMISSLIFQNLRQIGISPTVSVDQTAKLLVGMAHADIERICVDAIKTSILEGIPQVDAKVLDAAVTRQKQRILTTAVATGTKSSSELTARPKPRKKN